MSELLRLFEREGAGVDAGCLRAAGALAREGGGADGALACRGAGWLRAGAGAGCGRLCAAAGGLARCEDTGCAFPGLRCATGGAGCRKSPAPEPEYAPPLGCGTGRDDEACVICPDEGACEAGPLRRMAPAPWGAGGGEP